MNVNKLLKLVGPKLKQDELDVFLGEVLFADQSYGDSQVSFQKVLIIPICLSLLCPSSGHMIIPLIDIKAPPIPYSIGLVGTYLLTYLSGFNAEIITYYLISSTNFLVHSYSCMNFCGISAWTPLLTLAVY